MLLQQMFMNDMGKLSPSPSGDTPAKIHHQERESLRAGSSTSFCGVPGSELGNKGRNRFSLGLCMCVCV